MEYPIFYIHVEPYIVGKLGYISQLFTRFYFNLSCTDAGAYGLPNFFAEFLHWCHMYDLYRAAIIWVWPPIFGESKFGSPFRRKLNLPNRHATLVDFFWPTVFCFMECTRSLLYGPSDNQPPVQPTDQPNDQPTNPSTNQLTSGVTGHNSICPSWQNPPPIHRRLAIPFLQPYLLCRCLYCTVLLLMDCWISKNIMIILLCSLQERDGECLLAVDPSACRQRPAWRRWWQLGVSAAYNRYLSTTNACSCFFLKYACFLKYTSMIRDAFIHWHPHQLLLSCGAPYKSTLLKSRNLFLVTRLSKVDIEYSSGHTLPSSTHGYMRARFHICIGGSSSIIGGLFLHRSV